MWQCVQCHEDVEDHFDICWNCGTTADGVIDPEFLSAMEEDLENEDAPDSEETDLEERPRSCLRCAVPLHFSGSTVLNIGNPDDRFLASAEASITGIPSNQKWLDVYVCPQCGHVEFFLGTRPPPTFLQ